MWRLIVLNLYAVSRGMLNINYGIIAILLLFGLISKAMVVALLIVIATILSLIISIGYAIVASKLGVEGGYKSLLKEVSKSLNSEKDD